MSTKKRIFHVLYCSPFLRIQPEWSGRPILSSRLPSVTLMPFSRSIAFGTGSTDLTDMAVGASRPTAIVEFEARDRTDCPVVGDLSEPELPPKELNRRVERRARSCKVVRGRGRATVPSESMSSALREPERSVTNRCQAVTSK